MAPPRRKSLWQSALFIIVVKQMTSLGEAGRPFFGYGDEVGGGGGFDYSPQANERYDFWCDSWPVPEEGRPSQPPHYGECGSVRKASAEKYARTRQWVYLCVVGKARDPAFSGDGYYYNEPPHPDPPLSRGIRSGPYFMPEASYNPDIPTPPPEPEFFFQRNPFPIRAERCKPSRFGGGHRGGSEYYAAAGQPSQPSGTSSYILGPSQWGEENFYQSQVPKIRGGPSMGRYRPGWSSGGAAAGAGEERPKMDPNSVGPILFEDVQTESTPNATTAPTPPPTRAYAPYTRYGLQLIQ